MKLAFETATNICSVSFEDEEGKIHEKRTERKGSHSELLFLYVRELMKENNFELKNLDAVLVSTGPGSYTGLRIAASAVKGMFFGLDVDIYAANTLAGFAQCAGEGTIHAVINARRKHLYHQQFKFQGELEAVTSSEILELTEVQELISEGHKIIGTGIDRLDSEYLQKMKVMEASRISANGLVALFNSAGREHFFNKTNAEQLESNYLTSSQVNNTKL